MEGKEFINIERILELLKSENQDDFDLANNILEAQEIELPQHLINSLELTRKYIPSNTTWYPTEKYVFEKINKYKIRRETETARYFRKIQERYEMKILWGKHGK